MGKLPQDRLWPPPAMHQNKCLPQNGMGLEHLVHIKGLYPFQKWKLGYLSWLHFITLSEYVCLLTLIQITSYPPLCREGQIYTKESFKNFLASGPDSNQVKGGPIWRKERIMSPEELSAPSVVLLGQLHLQDESYNMSPTIRRWKRHISYATFIMTRYSNFHIIDVDKALVSSSDVICE